MALTPGTEFAGYQIEQLGDPEPHVIAYPALDPAGHEVELRIIEKERADELGVRRRFEVDLPKLLALPHANVVALVDVAEQDGAFFTVTATTGHTSLDEIVGAERPLDLARAAEVVIAVA